MCLANTVRQVEIKEGYKILGSDDRGLYTPFMHELIKKKEWNVITEVKEIQCYKKERTFYYSGFHIFPTLDDLSKYLTLEDNYRYRNSYKYRHRVCIVEYLGELAYGPDYTSADKYLAGVNCVVTSHMKIKEELSVCELRSLIGEDHEFCRDLS